MENVPQIPCILLVGSSVSDGVTINSTRLDVAETFLGVRTRVGVTLVACWCDAGGDAGAWVLWCLRSRSNCITLPLHTSMPMFAKRSATRSGNVGMSLGRASTSGPRAAAWDVLGMASNKMRIMLRSWVRIAYVYGESWGDAG